MAAVAVMVEVLFTNIGRKSVQKYSPIKKLTAETEWLFTVKRFLTSAPSNKDIFKRDKPHINIGTIGHFGHGKTTLTSAITKILSEKNLALEMKRDAIDYSPDERKRGMSINLSHIEYSTDRRHYGHIDCPGNIDYIKNTIAGISQMDAAILVVAARDGVKPQTREHLILAKRMGVDRVVVYVNASDEENLDKEILELVEMDVRELVTAVGMNGEEVLVIAGSALHAIEDKNEELGKKSIMRLLDVIDSYIPEPVRDANKPFVLPIDSISFLPGRGAIVRGCLECGTLKKGMECEIIGCGTHKFKAALPEIEMFHKVLEDVKAGDQITALFPGKKRDDLSKGMVVCKPKSYDVHNNIEAEVYVLSKEEGGRTLPFTNNFQGMLYSKTWACQASIQLDDEKTEVCPGEKTKLILRLNKPMFIEKNQKLCFRDGVATVATGFVSQVLPNLSQQDISKGSKKKTKETAKKQYA